MIRRAIPYTLLPLTILMGALASAPWLRSFPASVLAVPLIGAAILSVLVPYVSVRLVSARLWVTALVDLAAFVVYALLVVLRKPWGFGDLFNGLVHGPSSVLSFALPLVSPRSLLIAPIALCWVAGAIAGECQARRWFAEPPYVGWLVTFGIAWAATQRAAGDVGQEHLYGVVLAAALLGCGLLLRAAQSWVEQDITAEATQAGGVLPLRGLVWGVIVTTVVTLVSSMVVRSPAFAKKSAAPQRVPSISETNPVTPVAFIAAMRPANPKLPGTPVFDVTVDRETSPYLSIASVDYYDGDGWSFDRTFRPTGGVVPDDTDPLLRPSGPAVTQHYKIGYGPLGRAAPWMPAMYRPQQVSGMSVNVDATSGMIVPAAPLHGNQSYRVRSNATTVAFDGLDKTDLPATSTLPINVEVPLPVQSQVTQVITALSDETGAPPVPAVPFLQAVLSDFRANYFLASDTPRSPAAALPSSIPPSSPHTSIKPSLNSSKSPSTSPPPKPHTGSTSFSDVLTSIIGPSRSGTPEQYATLFALIARQLNVPARVVTGFRVTPPSAGSLQPGLHHVRTGQAWTWAEIPIVGKGWVVADSTPSKIAGPGQLETVGAQNSASPSAPPTKNVLITKGNSGHAVAKASKIPGGAHRAIIPIIVTVLAILLAFAIVVLGLMLLRKHLRRRRRRNAADARERLLGAWRESLDMLTESGMPPLSALTSTEVVSATGATYGAEPAERAAEIGQAANVAMYSTLPVSVEAAEAAWVSHRSLRKSVQGQIGPRARVTAALAYHRGPSAKVTAGPASWAETAARPTPSRGTRVPAGAGSAGRPGGADKSRLRRPLRRSH